MYDWVSSCSRKGEKILGNEIYKQLEAIVSIERLAFEKLDDG